jgi:K+/H+ antiporter YhaU regulatory subunit KhtT
MAEGLNIFTTPTAANLAGKTVAESGVRDRTGCTIIAVEGPGHREINPPGEYKLPPAGNLVLIGTLEAEERFLSEFGRNGSRPDRG